MGELCLWVSCRWDAKEGEEGSSGKPSILGMDCFGAQGYVEEAPRNGNVLGSQRIVIASLFRYPEPSRGVTAKSDPAKRDRDLDEVGQSMTREGRYAAGAGSGFFCCPFEPRTNTPRFS